MSVEVKYKSQTHMLTVEGTGPSLFGYDWLRHLRLDWKTIGITTLDKGLAQVEALQRKYAKVFGKDLGTMRHFQAHLNVKSGPTQFSTGPGPFPSPLRE